MLDDVARAARLAALNKLAELDDELGLGSENIRDEIQIGDYRLKLTSIACPEQYDVFNIRNVHVGYLRLRHGYFRADVPDCGGDTVYEAHTRGDGTFDADERMPQLTAAVAAIDDYWKKLMEVKSE